MPELWLRYGSSYSILDIKGENLLKHYRVSIQPMKYEEIKERLNGIEGYDGIILLDTSEIALSIVNMLSNKGVDIYATRADIAKAKGIKYINASNINGRFIFVSRAAVDPIFRYSCTLSRLIRSNAQVMSNAYANYIKQGVLEPYDYIINGLDGISIELLYNDTGLLALSVTDVNESYDAVKSMLIKQDLDNCKACVINPSVSDTLDDALLALWNIMEYVKDDGIIVLLAECRRGFSKALRMLIEGTGYEGYVEGLEYVNILNDAKKRYELCLVTMLPDVYIKRLGVVAFRGVNDALQYILKKGKHKVMVVSDAEIMDVRRDHKG
jgi:hypothetical protein